MLTSYLAFVSFRQNFRSWRFDCASRRNRTPLEDPFQLRMVGVFMLDSPAHRSLSGVTYRALVFSFFGNWCMLMPGVRELFPQVVLLGAPATHLRPPLFFFFFSPIICMLAWVHNTTSQQYHVTFLAARCRGHTLARISNAKKMTPETF